MKVNCPKFEDCSAPLCPLDESSLKNGVWYPGEEICKARRLQNPDWIRRQKAIVKARAASDKYFTVAMLQAIKQVRRGVEGINPDQPLEKAKEAERKWIAEKKGGRVIAKGKGKPKRVIAEEKANLVSVGKTSYQTIGGENDI
jgi:hypothetical protein